MISLTWASNINQYNWIEYRLYFKTLSESGFQGKKIVLTNDLSEQYRNLIQGYGFIIEDLNFEVKDILRERHRYFWEYLNNSSYDPATLVLVCDSRDVIFQRNPQEFLPNQELVLTSEGFIHRKSEWNIKDQFSWQRHIKTNECFMDWPVVNGGVIIGTLQRTKWHCFQLWLSMLNNPLCTDQAPLNYIYQIIKKNTTLCDPKESNLAITGEGMEKDLVPYSLIDNQVCNTTGDPYYIVHQWERVRSIVNKLIEMHA